MDNVRVVISQDRGWKSLQKGNRTLHFKGFLTSHSIESLQDILFDSNSDWDIKNILTSLDGNFAFILESSTKVIFSVDRLSSTPVIYTEINGKFYITDSAEILLPWMKDFVKDKDSLQCLLMSGYTIGNKTVLNSLKTLNPGEGCVIDTSGARRINYFKFNGVPLDLRSEKSKLLIDLRVVTIKIFRKLIESVNGRQIVIPLSAGYDSRLVASCLRDLNYKNVVCFSYGTSGNFEAKVAEKIARKLGYRWHFVPMTHMSEKAFLKSQDFKEYEKFSDSYNAIPYFQGLSSVKFLKENELIKDDAVFVNGNSGDFISGGHIQTFEAGRDNDCSKKNRMCHIVKKQIDKHYSLWGSEKTLHNVSKLSSMLILELESLGYTLGSVDEDYMLYEALEFHNRQSKYVIAGQKTFDFYGYDWRLPLWDKDYLDFWAKVPLNFKLDQALYKEMLFKSDFGDVWGELFPLNHKTISPSWVIPIRKLTQIPFFFFGKKGKSYWHKIEVCLFYYFMDDTHMMDYVGYLRGLRATFKFPRHHGSWQVLDYISKKVNG